MALALITGGGTGLGAALADRLAARGHDLLLVTRDPERVAPTARELAARYGVRADVLVADLGTRHGLFRLEAHLAGPEAPAVDVLVHDAVAASDAAQASVDLGMTATMRLTHAALPGMLRRGAGGIVAISGDEQSAAWAVSFVTALAPTLTGEVHVVAVRGDDRPEWTADAADAVLDDLDAGLVVSAPQIAPARPDPARRAVAAGSGWPGAPSSCSPTRPGSPPAPQPLPPRTLLPRTLRTRLPRPLLRRPGRPRPRSCSAVPGTGSRPGCRTCRPARVRDAPSSRPGTAGGTGRPVRCGPPRSGPGRAPRPVATGSQPT